MQFPI
jgi:hypothetical protein